MNKILVICLALLLLMLAGCQDLDTQNTSDDPTSVTVDASADAATPSASQGATDDTVHLQTSDTSAAPSDTASPSQPSSEADNTSPSPAEDEPLAPQDDVNTTLDEILQELNDLDQLYSQLDDVSDSDLTE